MNEFAQVTDAEFVYGELADGSQVKIDFSSVSKLLSIFNVEQSVAKDLNEASNVCNEGLSIIYIGGTLNSPIDYGACIHIQRSSLGDKSSSQIIFQLAYGIGKTFIRTGYGNGSSIVYYSWREM